MGPGSGRLGRDDRSLILDVINLAATASLPPALNVFIMARQYDTWVAQASGSVLFGTFVSVLTLTTTMWVVKTGKLPATLW